MNIRLGPVALAAVFCLGGIAPASAAPIQAGDSISVLVSGENTACSGDPTEVGPFEGSGTLSVVNVAGDQFDATVVFSGVTIGLNMIPITSQGLFTGTGQPFSGGGVSGTHNLSGVLLSTGINSSGTFQETTGGGFLCRDLQRSRWHGRAGRGREFSGHRVPAARASGARP